MTEDETRHDFPGLTGMQINPDQPSRNPSADYADYADSRIGS